jgi:hypothetical protein
VRDGVAGRGVRCPHCGAGTVIPKKSASASDSDNRRQPARQAERRADDEFPRPRPRRKKPQSEMGVALAMAGGFFALLAVLIGGIGLYLLQKGPAVQAASPREYALEQPAPQVTTISMAAMLDAQYNLHVGEQWGKEIKSATGGTISFRVTSQGPFSVTVVNEKAFKAFMAKQKGGYKKNDLFLVADSSAPEYRDYVTLPAGTSYFIIRNNANKFVRVRLECYPQ